MRKKEISDSLKRETLDIADAFLKEEGTCRSIAKEFELSKSSIHYRLTRTLPYINKSKYNKVRKLLDKNKDERAVRGGNATKNKHKMLNGGCSKKVENKTTNKKTTTSKKKASGIKKTKESKSK